MKPKRILLTTFSLALSLALWMPSSAWSDTNEGLKALISSGHGREIIAGKLDRIRLDRIQYDGLPLGEVVKHLMDEAKKRDPEKKGINFVVTSNGNIDGPPGEPAELVDINAVTIRILPPLTDVRLVDALDAVIRVADRPIQYSIEDYGVLLTLKNQVPEHKEDSDFAFPGGTPREFLEAVEKQYKVNWSSVADIPVEMQSVRVPALRMGRESLEPLLRRGRRGGSSGGRSGGGSAASSDNDGAATSSTAEQGNPLQALVALYNSLRQAKPELGQLLVQGDYTKPSVVLFISSHPANPASDFQMKAFPLKGIPLEEWDKLAQVAESQLRDLAAIQGTSNRQIRPTLRIHPDTALLIAFGPPSFLEAVGSFVTAWHANTKWGPNPSALK